MSPIERALGGIPRRPLAAVLLAVLATNAMAWVAALGLAVARPGTLALAALAWILGARHGFDVDHIAAIDNVTRKLRHDGRRSIAAGFYFALGHSSVVVALCTVVALGTQGCMPHLAELSASARGLGTGVSAAFLSGIGLVNLLVLRQLIAARRRPSSDDAAHAQRVSALLEQRWRLARGFRFLFARVTRSVHMYPIGVLFGLGFDTATEIAMLGISAGLAATGGFPLWGIVAFGLLFTAGMTLVDSLDGLVMLRAYLWAGGDARRRMSFNITITAAAAGIAVLIAALEWSELLGGAGAWRAWLERLDFGALGAGAVLAMLAAWTAALAHERLRLAARAAPFAGGLRRN